MTTKRRRHSLRNLVSDAVDLMPLEIFTTEDVASLCLALDRQYSRYLTIGGVGRMLSELAEKSEIQCVGKVTVRDPTTRRHLAYIRVRSYPSKPTLESWEWLWSVGGAIEIDGVTHHRDEPSLDS